MGLSHLSSCIIWTGAPQATLKKISLAGHDLQALLLQRAKLTIWSASHGLGLPLKIDCMPNFLVN